MYVYVPVHVFMCVRVYVDIHTRIHVLCFCSTSCPRPQALDAWWKQQGGQTQHLQCSCPGGDACQCEHDAENPGSEDVDVALRHETAQLLSLWWVAHGSATVVHAHPVAHPNCGHVGATGCGCRYYGCRC